MTEGTRLTRSLARGSIPGLRPLLTATLLVSLGSLLPPPVLAQTPAAIRQGYDLLDRGWVNDAIPAFEAALRAYPNSPEARLGLAIAYQRAGRDTDAWQAYQAVLQVAPDNATALTAMGELGGYRPEWQQTGIAALTRLLGQQPHNYDAKAQRALLYGYQGRYIESLADYGDLLSQDPSPAVVLGAAQIYAYSGDYTAALTLFTRYRQQGEIPATALTAYALALQQSGDPAAAVAVLTPLLAQTKPTDPMAASVRSALANATDARGETDQALTLLAPLQGHPEADLPLARALSAIGRRQEDPALFAAAADLYQTALAQTPTPSYGLRVEVADVLSEQPATQPQALAMFQQLVSENPTVVSLAVRSQLLAYRLGQTTAETTARQLQALLSPVPVSPPEQRAIATALIQVQQPDPALLPVYQTVAAAVDAPLLTYRIAQIELAQGNLAAARQALEAYRATPTGQQDWGADLQLADLERQSGDLEASARRYEALIQQSPDPDTIATALRGLTYVRTLQGQPQAALPVYAAVLATAPDNLIYQLGYALLAYRTDQLTAAQARAVLDRWLAANNLATPPPEVFELAGALPADPAYRSLYDHLLLLKPDDLWLGWRSIQLLAQTDPALAQTRLEALIAAHPDDLTPYFFQGELAQQQGNLPLAATAYQQILTQDPVNIGALSALGGVRFQQGDLQAARQLYDQVLSLNPEDVATRIALVELNVADDDRLTALDQIAQLQSEQPDNLTLERRRQDIEFDLLRRRGFQPPWERY